MKCKENRWVFFIDLNIASGSQTWAYEQTFFPLAQNFFPFSNPNPFPFEPNETKIREDNFSEMKEREESSSIFIVGERIYKVCQLKKSIPFHRLT